MMTADPASLKCVVCLEDFALKTNDEGGSGSSGVVGAVRCQGNHFICMVDFESFVADVVISQVYKLRDSKGSIRCPFEDCSCSYEPLFVHHKLSSPLKERFRSTIGDLFTADASVDPIRTAILELMVLRCPTCRSTVDPHPDACSAVMCLNCGKHYCNYCFGAFASGNSEKDRADAHAHVTTHNEAPIKDPFLSTELVNRGHVKFRTKQLSIFIRSKLAGISNSKEASLSNDIYVRYRVRHLMLALLLTSADLQDLSIDLWTLWMENIINPDSAVEVSSNATCDMTNPYNNKTSLSRQSPEGPNNSSGSCSSGGGCGGGSLVAVNNNNHENNYIQDPRKPKRFGGQQMFNAIISNNLEAFFQIAHAYRDSLDVDYVDVERTGQSLLSISLLMKLKDVVEYLLGVGANPLTYNQSGRSCLYLALEIKNNKEMIEMIVKSIPDININAAQSTEANKYCPIHVVTMCNYGNLVKYLVDLGADINLRESEHGYTPLMLALLYDHEWVAQELINHGADISAGLESNGRTALYVAAERGMASILELMVRKTGFDVNSPITSDGLRLIHVASLHKKESVVSYLIASGVDVNIMDDDSSHSALCNAVIKGNTEIALSLIEAGADVDQIPKSGRYPIFLAIEKGLTEVVRVILTKSRRHLGGINEPCETNTGRSAYPIHVAILFGRAHMLPMLISMGADINVVDEEGTTALHMAAYLKNSWAIEQLIRAGANSNIRSGQGIIPLYIAIKKSDSVSLRLLLKSDRAAVNVPVCSEENYLYCPIHVAALHDNAYILRVLVKEFGANIHFKDSQGREVVDIARENNAESCLYVLKELLTEEE